MNMFEVQASTTTMGLTKTLPKSVREEFAKAHGADAKQVKTTYDRVDLGTKEQLQGISIWKNGYLNGNLNAKEYFGDRKPLILNKGGRWQFFDMNDVTHFITEFNKRKIQYEGICNNLISRIKDGSYKAQLDKISGDLPVSPLTVEEVNEWKAVVRAEFYTDKPDGLMGELLDAYENGKKTDALQKSLPVRKFLMDELTYEIKQCTALLDPSKPRKVFKGRQENLNRIRDMIKVHLDNDADGEFTMLQGMLEKVEILLKGVQDSTSDKVADSLKDNIEEVKKGLKDISFADIFGMADETITLDSVCEAIENPPPEEEDDIKGFGEMF